MAAHIVRSLRFAAQKQFITAIRLCQRAQSNKLLIQRGSRLLKLTGTSTFGAGTSYALFGFSFGKKEESDTDPLTQLYRDARLAHHRQNLEKADELYHAALKLADEQLKKGEITKDKHLTARTMMYDGLADIALKTGRIDTARTLIVETMKGCLQQGMDKENNVIIELSLKLSSICAMQGQKEEAEEGYKFCIQAQTSKMEALEKMWVKADATKGTITDQPADGLEEKDQDTAVLMGMALGSYGRFLLHEKRFKEALPYFERARVYALHTLGTSSNQYIVMLNDIATLHIVTKDYDKADDVLRTALVIAKKSDLEEQAMLYCNLGALHLRRGKTEQASISCQKAAELGRKFGHGVASRMADACLKKCASIKSASNSTKT